MDTCTSAQLAHAINAAGFMLANSLEDVRAGRYDSADLRAIADGLESLVGELRAAADPPTVIDMSRAERDK